MSCHGLPEERQQQQRARLRCWWGPRQALQAHPGQEEQQQQPGTGAWLADDPDFCSLDGATRVLGAVQLERGRLGTTPCAVTVQGQGIGWLCGEHAPGGCEGLCPKLTPALSSSTPACAAAASPPRRSSSARLPAAPLSTAPRATLQASAANGRCPTGCARCLLADASSIRRHFARPTCAASGHSGSTGCVRCPPAGASSLAQCHHTAHLHGLSALILPPLHGRSQLCSPGKARPTQRNSMEQAVHRCLHP